MSDDTFHDIISHNKVARSGHYFSCFISKLEKSQCLLQSAATIIMKSVEKEAEVSPFHPINL